MIAAPLAYHTAWWENVGGSGDQWQEHQIASACSSGIHFNHPVDVNGDGFLDICGGSYWGNCVMWWENLDGTGTNWSETIVDSIIEAPITMASGDFDNDMDVDLVVASTEGNLFWYENSDGSGGTWSEFQLGTMDEPNLVSVSDINCDGRPDVISWGVGDGLVWFENTANDGIEWNYHFIDGCYLSGMDVKDVNGDGYPDVIACSENDRIQWWENLDGLGTSWDYHLVDDIYSWNDGLFAYDIDLDNDIDIVATSWHVIYWWENTDGLGLSWTRHFVSKYFRGASDVSAADLNGDGVVEVISTVFQGDLCGLSCWEISDLFSCSLISSILYLGNDPGWDYLDFTSDEPAGTGIGVAVRSTDALPMPDWQDTLYEPASLSGVLPENDSYFQYMVILTRNDPDTSPTFYDLTLSWNPVSVSDHSGSLGSTTALLPVSPSPSSSPPLIRFSLAEPSMASITVFDLTGRTVFRSLPTMWDAGYNAVQVDDLVPGVYFTMLCASGHTDVKCFVQIE